MKVIQYDYSLETGVIEKVIPVLQNKFGKFGEYSDVEYEFLSPKREGDSRAIDRSFRTLEGKLKNCDVLLIHPGAEHQKRAFWEYPGMFPNLRIALVSPSPDEYVTSAEDANTKIERLSYFYPQKIIDYILRVREEMGRQTKKP